MAIVTIAREYGAGGQSVAGLLAAELGATVIDRSLIFDVARRAALPAEEVAAEDEHGRGLLDRIARAFVPVGETAAGWATDSSYLVDHHAMIQAFTRAALREAARMGNAIIVGRGGAAELGDVADAFHVFLWAPEAARLPQVRARLGCDEATARREIHAVDARRAAYIREVYDVDWRDRSLYHLVMNTARLGFEGTAATILAALASRDAGTSQQEGGAERPRAGADRDAGRHEP